MKLLSSDYDLTLNAFEYDLYLNMYYINKFRKKNNIFLLNTGRNFQSIKKEIDKYHINYDYLSCCDGNLILDKENSIKYMTILSENILVQIQNLKKKHSYLEINPIFYKNNVLEFEIIALKNNLELYNALDKIAKCSNLVLKVFHDRRIINGVLYPVDVYYLNDKKISKSTSTSFVGDMQNIKKCDIFTIGDNYNDLEMVRDFNGYTLPWGKKEVKDVSNGICLTVSGLIKKILK